MGVFIKGNPYLCLAIASNDPRNEMPMPPKEHREKIIKALRGPLGRMVNRGFVIMNEVAQVAKELAAICEAGFCPFESYLLSILGLCEGITAI